MADLHQASGNRHDALYSRSYIVISPVRNEEEFLPRTIATMRAQTIVPLKWVIVNDGSGDNTAALAAAAARETPWIELVERQDRGFRQPGSGVVDTFYEGFNRAAGHPWQYVAKLDGDLCLPPDYFERLITAFEREPTLGICSGDIYIETETGPELDSPSDPDFHVRGAAKLYRRQCWDDIGGICRVTGFDTIDNVSAHMHGWQTRRLAELRVTHLRKTGQASGVWGNAYKNGTGAYAVGYHPAFVLAKCVRRACTGNPLDALGILCGYVAGFFTTIPRVRDRNVVRYLRRQQWNRLLGRESIWR